MLRTVTMLALACTWPFASLDAQQTTPVEPGAVIAALNHIRDDVPAERDIALQITALGQHTDIRRIAAALRADLKTDADLYRCTHYEDQPRSCTLAVAGALGVQNIVSSSPDEVHLIVWSAVPVIGPYGNPTQTAIYRRAYRMEIRRGEDGNWLVSRSELYSET